MIRRAVFEDRFIVSGLAALLWPDHTADELAEEFAQLLSDKECAIFLATQRNIPIGFAQVQLRHDYVEGTDTSPVAYLEGIFVLEGYRGMGIARQLLKACEQWALENGCLEFASDCELSNTGSLAFHLKNGFCEANRIICFAKRLRQGP